MDLQNSPPIGNENLSLVTPPPVAGKQRYPIMTWLTCAVCVVVFLGLASEQNQESWETLSKWGFLPVDQIRQGRLWALVSSVFVHQAIWHLAFNLYWLFVLGARVERAIGSARWLAFFIGAALVSSSAELTVADTTGIGASGVVYALFGFMWVTRKKYDGFGQALDQRTIIWFVLWLFGCLAVSTADIWSVGNAAHISGLLFGMGCGAWLVIVKFRRLVGLGFAMLIVVSFLGFFWAPWSADWTSSQAVQAHTRGDYNLAIQWYKRSLKTGQDKSWCWQNMALVYHSMGDVTNFNETMDELRRIDEVAAKKVEQKISSTLPK